MSKPKFDAGYIKQHRQQVHTYDSFARAVIDQALRTAEEMIKKNPSLKAPLTVPIEATVSPIPSHVAKPGEKTTMLCIDVTVNVAGIPATIHVGVG